MLLFIVGSLMKNQMMDLFVHSFTEQIHLEVTIDSTMKLLKEGLIHFAIIVSPIMAIAFIAAIVGNMLQVGVLFTSEPLKFDLKKIDPIQGAKRIFSVRALVELLKSLLKIGFIGVITFAIICMYKDEMLMLSQKSVESALGFFVQVAMTMGIAATIALLYLAEIGRAHV